MPIAVIIQQGVPAVLSVAMKVQPWQYPLILIRKYFTKMKAYML
jgi:hypothetical protein